MCYRIFERFIDTIDMSHLKLVLTPVIHSLPLLLLGSIDHFFIHLALPQLLTVSLTLSPIVPSWK